jgi:hypothetical protein
MFERAIKIHRIITEGGQNPMPVTVYHFNRGHDLIAVKLKQHGTKTLKMFEAKFCVVNGLQPQLFPFLFTKEIKVKITFRTQT